MKLLHITTIPMSLTFLKGQVGYMRERGFEVQAVSSPGEDLERFGNDEGVPVHAVPMIRQITPFRDFAAFVRIARVVREIRPDIVHAHTPKGGLLGMAAATLTRVPIRIYQMRGLPFVTAKGLRRRLLKLTERISCRMAHIVICNSHSMRQVALDDRLCPPGKIKVLLGGSGNGVDAAVRFNPGRLSPTIRSEVRQELEIPQDATVIGFVGRIVKEKGIAELEQAWQSLRDEYPATRLLIIGPFETKDPVPAHAVARLQRDPRVLMPGMEWDTPPLYSAMDVVVLPTHREGFPNVPLEAAAMELPVVATRIPGCVDAVSEGVTGLLVSPRDPVALADAIRRYLDDPELRRCHGQAGRDRVLTEFRQEALWEVLHQEYLRLARDRSERRGLAAKRAVDIVGACGALVLVSPLLVLLAILIRLRLGSPALFRQTRPGLHGKPFTLIKFRTMTHARSADGEPLADEERLTGFGQFLRRTSLDELPELWNVLRGEMSLVGPRPLLMEYLPLYSATQATRHDVLPGITGWAQIHGRNATTWEKRLELDAWYVSNRSLWLDLKILLLTLKKVVLREGIQQEGVATMTRFRGNPA
jgi:lipopolysaccharide/colanic/teichoic acid biosynthesis glycosyltransferase